MGYSIDEKNTTAGLIRRLRVETGLSQQQLAVRAGVSFSFVNQVEGGKQTVRLDAINKLLAVFSYTMGPILNSSIPGEQNLALNETPQTDESVRQKNDWAFF